MKDIEKMLKRGSTPKPQRPLRADFTINIIEKIESQSPQRTWLERFFGVFRMKFIQKPMMLVAAVVTALAIGGTTYAVVSNWPAITTIFGGEQLLKSGNRIVKVEADNCPYTKDLDNNPANKTAYYEVREDSHLTNLQVVSMIQGVCEETATNDMIAPFTGPNKLASRIMTITAIQNDQFTVVPDKNYRADMRTDKGVSKTYTTIARDVKVLDGNTQIAYGDLKVGDSVIFVMHDSRGISTEDPNYTEDLSALTVTTIMKTPPLSGTPDEFFANVGKEFVRVQPAADGDGFTRVYDF